ncbi:MAG: molybdopterin biosynthesis protein MoeA, partial [Synergistaceae bacterium]
MVKNYPEHLSLEEAVSVIKESFKNLRGSFKEEINISDALGHVLSEDITAGRNVPHYAASAVDGYALDASSTIGASPATPAVIKKEFYTWMNTGAEVPAGANSVLMVEDSSLDKEDNLIVYKTLTPSANVRPLGEDVMAGQIIAREGDVVSPALV